MSDARTFQLTIDDNDIAWLAIDVPGERYNTLQTTFADDIREVFRSLTAAERSVRGLVIHSLKPDNFIAGADIKMIDDCSDVESACRLAQMGQAVFDELSVLPFPTIAAINGLCLGGGTELALACRYRICSSAPVTFIGLPEIKLGIVPGSGGTQRLPRLIGLIPALDMMLSGKNIYPAKALKLGLIDAVVQPDALLEACRHVLLGHVTLPRQGSWRQKMWRWLTHRSWLCSLLCHQVRKRAQKKTGHHYPAIDALINVVEFGLINGERKGLDAEAEFFGELVMTPESHALRHLFFTTTEMKKRWKSDEMMSSPVAQIAVLGGGFMGAGIACVSIGLAGLPVKVKDVSEQGILNTYKYCYRWLKSRKARRIITEFDVNKTMSLLRGTLDYEGFEPVDMVIEAVFEDCNLKQQMVRDVENHCGPGTVFASNTSSIPISDIAQKASRPENIIGLHYFSPVEKMPLVEIIPHETTAVDTIRRAAELAYRQGKTPIIVKDKAGFYVNRILVPYIQSAVECLMAGEPIDKIDAALVHFGFPVGPFTLLDEVGFGVAQKIPGILAAAFGERFTGPDILGQLIESGRVGKRGGRGFYRYGKRKTVDRQVYKLLNITLHPTLELDEIATRCVIPLLNESIRCYSEGVIQSVQEGDIGAIYGIGFPPFLGGPFWYMHHLGLRHLQTTMRDYCLRFGQRYAAIDDLKTLIANKQSFY